MDAKDIGEHISSERRKRGLSLYRISVLTGVSIRHLHQIENGKHDVRVSTLQKILKAFNQQLNFTDT